MTTPLLLDYEYTIKPNIKKLSEFLAQVNIEKFYPAFFHERSGIIFIIKNQDFESLNDGILKSEDKINTFSRMNVLDYATVIFNGKKDVVVLQIFKTKYLAQFLESIAVNFPSCSFIYISCGNNYLPFVKNGFKFPFITDHNPLGDKISEGLSLLRKNDYHDITPEDVQQVSVEISYTLNPKISCFFMFKITKNSRNYLKNLTKTGSTLNNDETITQKEVSGALKIKNIEKKNKLDVFIMELNHDLTVYNTEETAEISSTLYNFHTHPFQAYVKYKVKYAWPSTSDYSAFITSVENNKTLFHTLASLEGIYIISLSPYWALNWKNLDISQGWIDKHYNLRKKTDVYTPKEYTSLVNKVKYKEYPVFHVQFSTWEEDSIFQAVYPKFRGNCFYNEDTYNVYKKIYEKI